jgi:predicted PurR-regulated permease PerM
LGPKQCWVTVEERSGGERTKPGKNLVAHKYLARRLTKFVAVATLRARVGTGMFSLDDRAGNVLTTVAFFLVTATILYAARGAFFILLLSLLFAYLLEPAVTWVQHHSRLGQNRTSAIVQVYLVGIIVIGGVGYKFGPHLARQIKNLNAAVPKVLESLSGGNANVAVGGIHGLNAAQQLRIQAFLAHHSGFITRAFERGAASAAAIAAHALWLFAVPILAIFLLQYGRQMVDGIIKVLRRRGGQTLFARILQQIDTMLAAYMRAQLALAGLSFVFYSLSMLVLGFPYAFALGFLGGILEFLPAVGWIAFAVTILTIGFLTHAHWIWMAGLLVVWRLVQDYVNSPRILGNRLKLRPFTVIFALMVGAQIGGIAGLYLSVPAVAVLRIIWLECFLTPNSLTSQSDTLLPQAKV